MFLGTGSGKTILSLARFMQDPTHNLLIVCPQKIISQWVEVVNEFTEGLNVLEFKKSWSTSKMNDHILENVGKFNCLIVNYEKLGRLTSLKHLITPDWTIILDECQYIKNYGTPKKPKITTKSALDLGELTAHKMILTATPTQAKYGGYIDYYTQLRFLGYLDMTYKEFTEEYCRYQAIQTAGTPYPINIIVGYKHTEVLDNLLKQVCVRYTPKFGEYAPQHIKINIDKTPTYAPFIRDRVYNDIVCDNVSALRVCKKTLTSGVIAGHNVFGDKFTYLDNTGKIDWLVELLSSTDERVVIFYNFNVELETIENAVKLLKKKYIVVNGNVKDKTKLIKESDFDVMIGQISACGEGIDGLQFLSHIMVFYSMPESSISYKQSIGRIDRIGQTKVPTYYYLLMKDTIDTAIYKMIEEKVEFSEEVLNKLELNEKGSN